MTGKEDNMSNVITNGTTIPGSTENFMTAFNKTALGIQEMFITLLNNFKGLPIKCYATNKPDYRLVKKNVFCELVILKKVLRIQLRTDDNYLQMDILPLKEMTDSSKPGSKWYSVDISDKSQVDKAYYLINEVYKFSN